MKHIKLYSKLPLPLKKRIFSRSGFSAAGTLLYAFAVSLRRMRGGGCGVGYGEMGGGGRGYGANYWKERRREKLHDNFSQSIMI